MNHKKKKRGEWPKGKYDLIVIDPPWPVAKIARKARPRQTSMDYAVMTVEEITKLPVSQLASQNALCFLWTTQKLLFEAFSVLEAYGFHYLLTMVWEKTYGRSAGMPLYGFCWNAEFVLVGYITKPKLWPKRPLIPACFQAENVKHSQKPQKFYDMIAPLGKRRLDLFARQRRPGWAAWGDELE